MRTGISAPTIVALLGLTGCGTAPLEKYGEVIRVQWITVATQREIAEKCGAERIVLVGGSSANPLSNYVSEPVADLNIRGCYRESGDVCVIYTLKPAVRHGGSRSEHEADRSLMETVGHEIEHCYRGLYHGEG